MANDPGTSPQGSHIDIDGEASRREWSRKLDVTEEQLQEAVRAVGTRASDVEEHLKGSRATTNSERTRDALQNREG